MGHKRKFIIFAAICMSLILMLSFITPSKKNIHNATTYELQSVYDIGDKLAISIHDYVEEYNVERVSELRGKILYLGDKRLKYLKEVYK